MLTLLIPINTLIFIALAILHLYWVFGGQWALEGAMPQKFKTNFFDPKYKIHSQMATFIVAIGLFVFAFITVSNLYIIDFPFPTWHTYLMYGIGAIFIVRGIGDFNLFGLFRRTTSDDIFTKRDRIIYTPLCLFLGIGSILIGVFI